LQLFRWADRDDADFQMVVDSIGEEFLDDPAFASAYAQVFEPTCIPDCGIEPVETSVESLDANFDS
jgi:hypothetical protein